MDRADTILMRRMDGSLLSQGLTVRAGCRALIVPKGGGRPEEYRPGTALPAAPAGAVYEIPEKPYAPAFAVPEAFTCLKPDGGIFRPGFCFTCDLRYISPLGACELLRAIEKDAGSFPDTVTLDMLYMTLRRKAQALCQEAAEAFSGGKALPYAHWWQELTDGAAFAASLERALLPLFNRFGFRLEPGSLRISGVAPIPLD